MDIIGAAALIAAGIVLAALVYAVVIGRMNASRLDDRGRAGRTCPRPSTMICPSGPRRSRVVRGRSPSESSSWARNARL